jgi:hypothetical protein
MEVMAARRDPDIIAMKQNGTTSEQRRVAFHGRGRPSQPRHGHRADRARLPLGSCASRRG